MQKLSLLNKTLIVLLLVSIVINSVQWYINKPRPDHGNEDLNVGRIQVLEKEFHVSEGKEKQWQMQHIKDSVALIFNQQQEPILITHYANEKNNILFLPADSLISDVTNRFYPKGHNK